MDVFGFFLLGLFSLCPSCLIRGNNARKLGWVPQYGVEHLMSSVDDEVAFIVKEDLKLTADRAKLS